MQRFTWTVAALALLGGGVGSARADHLYNTFGPGDSFNTNGSGDVVASHSGIYSYVAEGMAFSPSQTATLDLVRFAASGVQAGSVDAVLAADNGGQPGVTLEDLGSVSVTGSPTIYSLSSSLHPLLTVSTTYWLILQPTDPSSNMFASWAFSSPVVNDTRALTTDPAHGSWRVGNDTAAAFDIQGTAATATPEPASLTLLGVGAVCLLGHGWRQIKWRRRKEGRPCGRGRALRTGEQSRASPTPPPGCVRSQRRRSSVALPHPVRP
jgi:hypothetical protein